MLINGAENRVRADVGTRNLFEIVGKIKRAPINKIKKESLFDKIGFFF
jgi:hypothetical protein